MSSKGSLTWWREASLAKIPYEIDQALTPSLLNGLVKLNLNCSISWDWVREMMVALLLMLTLFWLSQIWPVTSRIQKLVFSGCLVPPDSKETKLGSSNQKVSPTAGKHIGVVLVLCCPWKCFHTAISSGVDISKALRNIRYDRWVLSESHKITSRIRVSWTHSLPFWFWPPLT